LIKYLKHNEIDRVKWDECISRSFNGIIYGYSWYLDVVCKGWEALVEDDYEKVMPLTGRKKFGISYLYQPFFTQQLGVFSTGKLSESDTNKFIEALPSHFGLAEISLNTFNQLGDMPGVQKKQALTHELDLISPYETLHKQYAENTKRNLKKAIKHGLTISESIAPQEIVSLFKSSKGKEVKAFRDDHYEMLLQLIRECANRGKAQVWGVKDKSGRNCAGAFFVESNGKVIFLFSGRNEDAKDYGAMFFLIDRFIAANAQRNLILDFEGSNDSNLARFYKGFGSKECVYLQVTINNLPTLVRWLKKAK
jgi:hypothetical protein